MWVTVYRVYGVPLDDVFLQPLVTDFGSVRAAFVRWDAPYRQLTTWADNTEEGGVTFHLQWLGWSSTGNGVLLLLLTPMSGAEEDQAEFAARERVSLVRSVAIATLGRNAAFELAFGCDINFRNGRINWLTPHRSGPIIGEEPQISPQGLALMHSGLENLASLDEATQSRIKLALRWYERSFGDDWVVRDRREATADELVNCWVALEALVSAGEPGVAGQIIKRLAKIHGIKTQQAGQTFPVSRAYKMRKKIIHQGDLVGVQGDWHSFLSDVFVDLLLDTLGVLGATRTQKYVDGTAPTPRSKGG